jgi:rod shape determining protein RodA
VASLFAAYRQGDSLSILKPYQLARIKSFVTPIEEGGEASYHLRQSVIAIGSGGATGKGLGQGTQNTLRWLPESHTDFIFSVIGEEWGFIGAAGVALLFLFLVVSLLRIAILTREPFGRLVVTGIAVAIAAQSLENMGMTMQLTPITGVPLPFVSHGGSSLLTSYIALGVASSVGSLRVRVVASADLSPKDPCREPVLVPRPAAALLRDRWAID